jgi:hypothetical protein
MKFAIFEKLSKNWILTMPIVTGSFDSPVASPGTSPVSASLFMYQYALKISRQHSPLTPSPTHIDFKQTTAEIIPKASAKDFQRPVEPNSPECSTTSR